MKTLKRLFGFLTFVLLLIPQLVVAQDGYTPRPQPQEVYQIGTVAEVKLTETREVAGFAEYYQELEIDLWGDETEKLVEATYTELLSYDEDQPNRAYKPGDWVTALTITQPNGVTTKVVISDYYRLPWLGFIGLIFFVLVVIFAGWKGLRSFAGLLVSLGLLSFVIVPAIVGASYPLIPAIIGAIVIAAITFYVSHGFNRRITVALVSTIITLIITVVISQIFVNLARLFGTASEESLLLELGQFGSINLQGLLLAGIIIGVLGVLDDITVSQTATIAELKAVNKKLTAKELYKHGIAVGKEHIAALVNTLVLAYAGAFLPLFLIFMMSEGQPLWFLLNSEMIAEEIVRTLIGSVALLFAVPITTYFAAKYVEPEKGLHKCNH